jgi:hypothetical protein
MSAMSGSNAAAPVADLAPDVRLERTGAWLATRHEDMVIMMHTETGRFISLNATGARIWGLLETPSTLNALAARIAEEFRVTPAQAITDMTPLVSELLRNGALSFAQAPAD